MTPEMNAVLDLVSHTIFNHFRGNPSSYRTASWYVSRKLGKGIRPMKVREVFFQLQDNGLIEQIQISGGALEWRPVVQEPEFPLGLTTEDLIFLSSMGWKG